MKTELKALRENINNKIFGHVCVADVNYLMQTLKNLMHMQAFHDAFMVTSDGTPLSLVAKLKGVGELQQHRTVRA